MKLLSLFFICLMVCLIIGSSSLRISNHQDFLQNYNVGKKIERLIRIERDDQKNNLEKLKSDEILNQIDEALSNSKFSRVWGTEQFELNSRQSTNGVLELDSEIGVPDTFVVRASDFESAWRLLNKNQQWRKIMLEKDTKLFGAAVLNEYYVVSLKKGNRDSTISQDQKKIFLQAFKKSIKAQNRISKNEDLDLSNRIAEWFKNGKPMGSLSEYFYSISYKSGDILRFKDFKGSWKAAYDKIVNFDYFKMGKQASPKFGIAADEVNSEGETTISVVFSY